MRAYRGILQPPASMAKPPPCWRARVAWLPSASAAGRGLPPCWSVSRWVLESGFKIESGVSGAVLARCCDLLAAPLEGGGQRRVFERVPELSDLLVGLSWRAEEVCGCAVVLCRSILFDKTPTANWKVGWHQDVTLSCSQRFELDGWRNWTEKDGLPHVQPPVAVLESMLTLRLHLEPCGSDNGPLRVLPGSHRSGRLSPTEVAAQVASVEPVECACEAGEVLLMRPLLVHSSSSARAPGRRRVVHLEFCPRAVLPAEFTT